MFILKGKRFNGELPTTILIDWISPHDHSRVEIRDLKYRRLMTVETEIFMNIIKESDWNGFIDHDEREVHLTKEQQKELFS